MQGRLRVLNWNVNAFTSYRFGEKLDLLERLEWDVATLQELLPGTIDQLLARFPDSTIVTREPNETWPRPGARHRCAVVISPTANFVGEVAIECDGDQGVAGSDPSPVPREVLVAADLDIGGAIVTLASAQPPHSSGRDDHEREWRLLGKLRTYAALSRFAMTRRNVLVGMDANAWLDESPYTTPTWADTHPQASVMRFFFDEPPEHGLRDAFRVWLGEHPEELAEIKRRRPNGPLALTFVRGRNKPVADRFDVIMIPRTLQVDTIEHNYEDAVAVGSDHAYVLAELSTP